MTVYSWKMTAEELEAYKHEKAALVMEALREGKTAREIYGGTNVIDQSTLHYKEYGKAPKRFAGTPIWNGDSVKAYKARYPAWAAEFDRLAIGNAAAKNHLKGSHKRNQTHCVRGHPFSGDNLRLLYGGTRRKCKTCEKENYARAHVTPEKAREVMTALRSGETIASITGGGKSTYLLNHRAIMVLRRQSPKLDKLIVDLSAKNARAHISQGQKARRLVVAAPALSNNMGVLDQINAAVPRYISEHDRQDIIADIWTAVAEGQLKPSDIKAHVNRFVIAHRKMYQTTDRWGPKSLDAPAYLDSPVSLIETLRDDQGLWR